MTILRNEPLAAIGISKKSLLFHSILCHRFGSDKRGFCVMRKKDFMASLEVAPTLEGQLDGAIGAFVDCFVSASSIEEALELVKQALLEDNYRILEVEGIRLFSAVDMEDDDAQKEYHAYAEDARRLGDVVYSKFDSYAELD